MQALVADDDATTRMLCCGVLAELGHEADQAADGMEAWTRYAQGAYPLVVLDIEMPQLDGVALCRRIRDADTKRESFIIVITGRDHPEDLAEVMAAGADDYVTKPTTVEHLRARFVIAGQRIALDAARRRAEAELAVARWRAGIGETAIALQHEINNPLSALLGHAELLRMEYEDRGERNEQADVILDQARRIAEVVKRIARLRDPQSVEYVEGSRMIDLSGKKEDGP